ncbi:MAG: indole-3-glycerol phosphate synthase TrpC [Dethiobacter sp.]|jgi:indole-3-glycerol phosphate synthase|nr:indole-3-glycerol phosphate synthase TrpC [Dethiobacter sp.]MBS3990363.1 indole-3-glycerol phosphate synthase TrpC [Dethiobacter sp.]
MLSQIVAKKKERLAAATARLSLRELKIRSADGEPPRPFGERLAQTGVSLIGEVKKASPSKGKLGLRVDVEVLAKQYEMGGAQAISVLTEEDYFLGSIADLQAVRAAVSLPVLRKDFVLTEYQLYESRYLQADAVLLIARLLSHSQLQEYLSLCRELKLGALVEAHNGNEVELALLAGAKIVGINNRDLATFKIDLGLTVSLASMVPDEVLLVSESGIQTAAEVAMLKAVEVDAILVGETLVRSPDVVAKIRELLAGEKNDQN